MEKLKMIEAVGKNIIIKPVFKEKSGVLILTNESDKPLAWEIVSMGDDVKGLSIGDKLTLAPYGMHDITYKGEKYYVCQLENVLAKNVL